MKIGIITLYNVFNFGAELQAYATQKKIEMMGYEAELIDYPFYKDKRYVSTPKSKPVFQFSYKDRLIEWIYPKAMKFKAILHYSNAIKKRANKFSGFHKEFSCLSKEYRTAESLYSEDLGYDVYMVGSDQVWNPTNYTSLDPYFLKFAPIGKKRISYASSIGLSEIPAYAKEYYKLAWQTFDAISVREENAANIVQEISGKPATCVLDPTLLLNAIEWHRVGKKVEGIEKDYLLLYEITPCPYIKNLAKHIANEKGLQIVRINKDTIRKEKDSEILNILDAGPSEFIWLFENACFVVTNSFHGTAFSINMNKDFYVVAPERKKNNSRQQSILRLFGLTDRLVPEHSEFPDVSKFGIDYSSVNALLESERLKSMEFLKNAIDGE